MASKYELPFSTGYVPDWTYLEACRELFQNALDNQIENAENQMTFQYEPENMRLIIANKNSELTLDSLLLGSTTKADNEETIGRHGEGYKIAILVLLREGKGITVYNYGRREVWNTRLVQSRRYNKQFVPVISVNKEYPWAKVPKNSLEIVVDGITEAEWQAIKDRNLHLKDNYEFFEAQMNGHKHGEVLMDAQEKGRVYVGGLYVCDEPGMAYGYNFEPNRIKLDRDRKLVRLFDVQWETAFMWRAVYDLPNAPKEAILQMIEEGAPDTKYITQTTHVASSEKLANDLAIKFKVKYGDKAVPVSNNDDMTSLRYSGYHPVLVNGDMHQLLRLADIREIEIPEPKRLSEEFRELLDEISDVLTGEQYDKMEYLICRLEEGE
jgi:hypothetical protein